MRSLKYKKIACCVSTLLLCLFSLSCKQKEYSQHSFFAMDTFVFVEADTTLKTLENAQNEVLRIEALMSKTDKQSEIYKLNKYGSGELSDDTLAVVEKSLKLAEDTSQAFSPALGLLVSLWNITGENPCVPSEEQIKDIVEKCNYKDLALKGNTAFITNISIDLGAVAKGYAAQKAIEALRQEGVQNAMLSLGGNVAVCGSSQKNLEKSIEGWNVGIRNPKNTDEILGYVVIKDKVCAVSGAYERFFEKDGIKYHHILDRFSGYPAQSDLCSAAVISEDGAVADGLSTAFFVMGLEKSMEFYKKGLYDFEAVFIDHQNNVYTTDNIEFKKT